MAAPKGTIWGDIVRGDTDGRQGKLGVYIYESNKTNTKITFKMQIWFATIYSCSDGDGVDDGWLQNELVYYNGPLSDGAPNVSKGEFSIQHTVNTGSAWNTNNQTKLSGDNDILLGTYDRGNEDKVHYVNAQFKNIDMLLHKTVYSKSGISYTIPAIDTYTITYHANTASDRALDDPNWSAPSQTKNRGDSIILHGANHKPTSVGWTCNGWYHSSDKKLYNFGESYTKDANTTLYANWIRNKYTITFYKNADDAVAGTQTSGTQTHDSAIKLPSGSEAPTRPMYNFLGWATTSTATTAEYAPGASYKPNREITLFAVWERAYIEPSVTNIKIERCDSDGNPDDEGTGCNISFSWRLNNPDSESARIAVQIYSPDDVIVANISRDYDTTSGDFSETNVAADALSTENAYAVYINITDYYGDNRYVTGIEKTLSPITYPIDVLAGGKGIAFGKPAKKSGVMDVGFVTEFNEKVNLGSSRLFGLGDLIPITAGTDVNTITTPGVYSIQNSDIGASLLNFRPGASGRLEVWTANGRNTDNENYRRHIIQRYTSIDGSSIWTRYMQCSNTTHQWTVGRDWQSDALRAYPVGSIYMAYNHNKPADLFGGTWERISPYFPYAAGSSATIGETGDIALGGTGTVAHFIKISMWRRTA